jgi:hypothetical protein
MLKTAKHQQKITNGKEHHKQHDRNTIHKSSMLVATWTSSGWNTATTLHNSKGSWITVAQVEQHPRHDQEFLASPNGAVGMPRYYPDARRGLKSTSHPSAPSKISYCHLIGDIDTWCVSMTLQMLQPL